MTGDDNQSQDIRTILMPKSRYQPVCPEEQSQYELDTQDVAILTMQPDPYRPQPQTPVSNPYSRVGYMDHTCNAQEIR